jgi:hypothetical protein
LIQDKAWTGEGRADAIAERVGRAVATCLSTCLLLWLTAERCAWLR